MTKLPRILYCNCTYAQVVPREVKEAVLRELCNQGLAFEAVADLCEMSARRDPALKRLASGTEQIRIAACYPRAVKWLFEAAQAPLPPERTEVLNMRLQSASELLAALSEARLTPNLTLGKTNAASTQPSAAAPEVPPAAVSSKPVSS